MKTGTAGKSLQRSAPRGCSHPAPLSRQIQPVPGNRKASWQSQAKPVGGCAELCWCHCLTSPETSGIGGAAAVAGPRPPHCSISHLPVYSQTTQGPPMTGIPQSVLTARTPQFPAPCTAHHRDPPNSTGSLMSVSPDSSSPSSPPGPSDFPFPRGSITDTSIPTSQFPQGPRVIETPQIAERSLSARTPKPPRKTPQWRRPPNPSGPSHDRDPSNRCQSPHSQDPRLPQRALRVTARPLCPGRT